ncbi:hypothetical protein Vadar_005491 [Vaccinium darrowii]|uniref:Uncharacterized protein n=1 Tax=Vaccinium darrowii TaxID=229202 RepID=A0ACB7ZBQ9_9ERIC|nr:hypothetical protein Vadar_005491 [Vaccinium darrowii]
MGISKFPVVLIFTVVVVVTMVTSRVVEAQTPSCLSSLSPCAAYLSGTGTPPASCCTPLKEAMTNQFQCLCNLYANPSVLQNLGINATQAAGLPARCNIATGSCSTAHFIVFYSSDSGSNSDSDLLRATSSSFSFSFSSSSRYRLSFVSFTNLSPFQLLFCH